MWQLCSTASMPWPMMDSFDQWMSSKAGMACSATPAGWVQASARAGRRVVLPLALAPSATWAVLRRASPSARLSR